MATKKERGLIETSKAAYEALDQKKLSEIHCKIVYSLAVNMEQTAQEIATFLRLDYYVVQRRISEVRKQGVIIRTDRKRENTSEHNAFIHTLAQPVRTDAEMNYIRKRAYPDAEAPKAPKQFIPPPVQKENKDIKQGKLFSL